MEESLHRLSKLFQVLANGVRLKLLKKLLNAESSVSVLSAFVDRSTQVTSHHLRLLRDNDLIASRTEGKHILYRIKRPILIKAALALGKHLRRQTD